MKAADVKVLLPSDQEVTFTISAKIITEMRGADFIVFRIN